MTLVPNGAMISGDDMESVPQGIDPFSEPAPRDGSATCGTTILHEVDLLDPARAGWSWVLTPVPTPSGRSRIYLSEAEGKDGAGIDGASGLRDVALLNRARLDHRVAPRGFNVIRFGSTAAQTP